MAVYVGRLQSKRCPVTAAAAYMVQRGDQPGPFVMTRSKTPLLKSTFVAKVRFSAGCSRF